ncbi:MAG: MBL fold metallo-hydrolase [Hyphomicrobiaceae bacterium]
MTDLKFKTEMEFAYQTPRELAPGVTRIVANNPSVFTYKGTNTYIIGGGGDIAVIDPGPEDEAHFDAVMATVGKRQVSHIVITHTHRDHIDGVPRLADATGAKICAFGRTARNPNTLTDSPSGAEFFDQNFTPDITVKDGDRLAGSDWTLKALFTPGHAPDHLSFELVDQKILFSGDHVMGWNTSVVAPPEGNMADYLASLERLLDRNDAVYFPGHGGQIPEPQRFAKAYLLHRRVREQSILKALKQNNTTIAEIVTVVYKDLDPRLVRAASMSVQAHAEHLAERGIVELEQPVTFDSQIALRANA